MNLGFGALFPRLALHYKFPGFLNGEKTRNIFQFTYSTSRGFGFPIYFGPEFYGYILTIGKFLEPLFKWSHTICHRANQAIYLVGKKYGIKRHHPGEFESVIISEYKDNLFKGIDTLLHGYYTQDPKTLGVFSSLENALDNVTFSYSVGDHAMSVESEKSEKKISVPLITHDSIVRKYNVNFYDYLNNLLATEKVIKRKIIHFKQLRKEFISNLKRIDRIKFRIDQSKSFSVPSLKISQKFSKIQDFSLHIRLMEIIIKMLWTTPLYTHTIHKTIKDEFSIQKQKRNDFTTDFNNESIDSIFLLYIKKFEKINSFSFKEMEVINELVKLRDNMGTMWLYFKEKHFNFALKKLNDLSTLSLDDFSYRKVVNEYIDNLIPIFSIYEIFNRALSESVYPESVPHTKRLGGYLASLLTSRFNPFGVNLMNLFNKLAFNNWSYLIINRKLNRKQFFKLIVKLPIWKNIPKTIKKGILNLDF
ncbi:MAG: hypothetical protein KGD68_13420 [Candidatus Lokiarchaeota archaeon]|nr:hypothetical protein [Candidatus Lokiarchaeota archaeon]